MIKKFAGVIEVVKSLPPKKVADAVAARRYCAGSGAGSCWSGKRGVYSGGGQPLKITQLADKLGIGLGGIEIINEPDAKKAAYKAVSLVYGGKADF